MNVRLPRSVPSSLAALALASLFGCGGGAPAPSGPSAPFTAFPPREGPGTTNPLPPPAPPPLPPPTLPTPPVWTQDAFPLGRTALFGSFPADVVGFDGTVFVSDADAIEAAGARILALAVGAGGASPSARYATTTIRASDLVDSDGHAGDAGNAPASAST